jgi:hypothetical protein
MAKSKLRVLVLPKGKRADPAPGYERVWYVCKRCGRKAYRDYVPYSLGNPILTLPCGHSFYHDAEQFTPYKRSHEEQAVSRERM